MTTLSPRLAHLLIHEDRSTGALILPDGRKVHNPAGLSPPLSPLTVDFDISPSDAPKSLPSSTTLLPPPRLGSDRQHRQSIFSILNEARQQSPPSSASSAGTNPGSASGPLSIPLPPRQHSRPLSQGNESLSSHLPSPGMAHSVHPSSYDNRGTYFPPYHHPPSTSAGGPVPPRPDIFRRHSSHPYEYAPSSRPGPYSSGPSGIDENMPMSGSRAPISRTTKACNACRSRKVRCDAGGLPGGEPSTCSRCREAGVDCIYSGPQKKRGPCPGTVRPATGNRSRRPSHRSSVASIVTTIMTPPSEDEWSYRNSYGFPADDHSSTSRPSTHDRPPMKPLTPTSASATITHRPSMPVLSWPGMQPAVEMDDPAHRPRSVGDPKVFRADYSMRASEQELEGRRLPPLRIAIERRESYYSP